MKNKSEIKNILIIQTAFPGDIILTTPLIQGTRHVFPEANIDFLTIPACTNLIETQPEIRQVLVFAKHQQHKSPAQLWRFARHLKKNHYDLALIPHRSIRSAMLAFTAKIPIRIGFDTSAGSFLMTHKIKYRNDWHEVERNLSLLSVFQEDLPQFSPQIFPDHEDKVMVDNYLCECELKNEDLYTAIAPGSVWETKKWLKEYFAELCDLLHDSFQKPIMLIGGQADYKLCQWISQNTKAETWNTAGKFTFRQSADLLSRCKILVTNDSAPLHLGVSVQTRVLAIFGPTVKEFGFYPYGDNHQVIGHDVYCRPCGIHGGRKCPTGTFSCMKSIKPDEILTQIQNMLSK